MGLFPTDAIDGDEVTNANGTTFKYVAADDKWIIVSDIVISDVAYNEGTWDANPDAATKDAIRDKVVAMDALIDANTTVAEVDARIALADHDTLLNPNGNADEQHLTAAQVAALHSDVIVSVANVEAVITAELVNGQSIDNAIDALVRTNLNQLATRNHSDLQNKNTEANIKHMTDAQITALHTKQHAMDSATYHTSSDIATLNSSITKHGFLKKLDNNALNFMNGEGNWAEPAGGGNGGQIYGYAYLHLFGTAGVITDQSAILNAINEWVMGHFYCHAGVDTSEDVVFTFIHRCTVIDGTIQMKHYIGANAVGAETYNHNISNGGAFTLFSGAVNRLYAEIYTFAAANINTGDKLHFIMRLNEARIVDVLLCEVRWKWA